MRASKSFLAVKLLCGELVVILLESSEALERSAHGETARASATTRSALIDVRAC